MSGCISTTISSTNPFKVYVVDLGWPIVLLGVALEVKYRIFHILLVDLGKRIDVPLGLHEDLDRCKMLILFTIVATHLAIDATSGGTRRGLITVS